MYEKKPLFGMQFHIEWFHRKTRFDTEAKGHAERVY